MNANGECRVVAVEKKLGTPQVRRRIAGKTVRPRLRDRIDAALRSLGFEEFIPSETTEPEK